MAGCGRRVTDVTLEGPSSHSSALHHASARESPQKALQRLAALPGTGARIALGGRPSSKEGAAVEATTSTTCALPGADLKSPRCPPFGRLVSDVTLEGTNSLFPSMGHTSSSETLRKTMQRLGTMPPPEGVQAVRGGGLSAPYSQAWMPQPWPYRPPLY
eukprot:gnl/MRDRNA2_/MRDRNA2_121305_c0_seq1.p1 gnl/MRDRNA2_/MRDRNA2_121305_c0~~gnl/MRDRNA2_/MRDRNA2_121305_c0_seq1.p1  ORF type:complete len:181 (+),score=26.42 gnl/MRDRNA2_/MRDRNA2_121305_c0_seq1:69-545(+)